MKSSPKAEPPFAADGGMKPVPLSEDDPYQALDDLLAAVEAFCPVWPPRDGAPITRKMLL